MTTTTVPPLMYGTAWKEERTATLVTAALDAGFRAIDTANQRKHYHEAGVGEGLKAALKQGVARDALFLQTKFTYVNGQDHCLQRGMTVLTGTTDRSHMEQDLASPSVKLRLEDLAAIDALAG